MKAKNAKIKDLEFATDNKAVIEFKDEKVGFSTLVGIEKSEGHYRIFSIERGAETGEKFISKMNRYVKESFDTEDNTQRKLDSLQYYSRKEITRMTKAIEDINEVTEEASTEVDQNEATSINDQIQEIAQLSETEEEETAEPVSEFEQAIAENIEANQEPKPEQEAEEVHKIIEEEPKVGLEAKVYDFVRNAINSRQNLDAIKYHIKRTLDDIGIVPGRMEVVLKDETNKTLKNVGSQHKQFKTVLLSLKAKVNLALVGPAGSFKTATVTKVAEVLGLPFYSKSVSAQTGVHEFFGYQDANGNYVRTPFRDAYENGGIFLLDEFDAGNPNVLASMNQATANDVCAFADGMIKKHKDFLCVMAGNTFGNGATSKYVGRNKIDAATLDRFAFLNFEYDEKFERELAPNKEWCDKVQAIRAKVIEKKIKTIVSPRATFNGAKLLAEGISEREVKKMIIYKGLSQDEINLIK